MRTLPLVSIIIPLYNAEAYIGATLESALAQTWPRIEILVIDDGSTDCSFAVAHRYESKSVKVVRQSNSGPAKARNYGLSLAQGEYIQFLDADDLLSINKIEAQVRRLEEAGQCLSFCRTVFFKDGTDHLNFPISECEALNKDFSNPIEFLITLLGGYPEIGGMVQPNAWLTPRAIINRAGLWNEALHPNPDDDGEFFFRVIMESKGVLFCGKGLNYYRKFPNQSSSYSNHFTNLKTLYNLYKTITLKEQLLFRVNNSETAKKCIAKQYTELMIKSFPYDKNVSRLCKERLKEIGPYYYLPVIGGPELEVIKKLFGWKTARYFSFLSKTMRYSFQQKK